MNLEEYIRQSYTRPNRQVLESLGASEELVEYLLKTPWNTNIQMIDSIEDSKGETLHTMTLVPTEFTSEGSTKTMLAYKINNQEISDFLNPPSGKVPIGTFEFSLSMQGQTIEGKSDFYIYRNRSGDNSTFLIAMNSQEFPIYVTKGNTDTNLKNYLVLDLGISEGSITINYEVIDGYKIKIDTAELQYSVFFVKQGNSFTIPGTYPLFDGTNTYSPGDIITPTSDINLTLPPCTVTFDANGGSNPHTPISVPFGGELEYSNYESGMTPPEGQKGLSFQCWTTEKNNDNTKVFQQDPSTGERAPLMVRSDMTLYARWVAIH